MPRLALNIYSIYSSAAIAWVVALLCFSACSPSHKAEVDRLNSLSYAYHYRSLDSTRVFAERALRLSADYASGRAEAHNNLAFVAMAKMDYASARKYLDEVERNSDNQIEILIAHVQNMRLCQRESRNKDFYAYREKAMRLLRRTGEEAMSLPPHERQRALYAHSEFAIVSSAYFYYVGQEDAVRQSLEDIDVDELEQDTAQYLNYLYSVGSGGVITNGTAEEICQTEFDYLLRCFMLASGSRPYSYWQANALQAISEHLQSPSLCSYLLRENRPAIKYLNVDQVPDSLLAGNFAQYALSVFSAYGDVYQVAGAYRTLGECYWAIGDYRSAAQCLNHALYDNKAINAAPDLVASICERLCLVYSAIDDKPHSDYNRNLYLDLQERTRQDRQLEARATMLDENARVLNLMIAAVVGMIVLVCVLLFLFYRMGRRGSRGRSLQNLLQPLEQWRHDNEEHIRMLQEKKEEINERMAAVQLHVQENKRRHLEQRAKVSLVNSIMPFIDRMKHEVDCLATTGQTDRQREERYQYIRELTEKINQYNGVLTSWIQMRQGTLNLHIVSFPLQPLFDIVGKARMGFAMKGIDLIVEPTSAIVKADRTLTLFMVNTITDNARKFTPCGGSVRVCATDADGYVEISVADTGSGMDSEQAAHVFDRTYTGGHGFGLVNCQGIIEKYKKLSSLFAVCDITVKSEVGKGSVFSFRLPHGIRKATYFLLAVLLPFPAVLAGAYRQHAQSENLSTPCLQRASAFADSAYFSNINATYSRTLQFADSARYWLNQHYLQLYPDGKRLMMASPGDIMPAELMWYHDSLPTNYNVILDLRNESAVAALALHRWSLYQSNNKVYTQLYREMGTDSTLPSYVRTMQVSENSKTVAVVLLVLLLLLLPVAYYLLYWRHVLFLRFAMDKVEQLNAVLLSGMPDSDKLARIERIWSKSGATLLRGIAHRSGDSARLSTLVAQIQDALRQSVVRERHELTNIEEAEDCLRRDEYENGRLYVSCSVLDNTLSALKHETMYYPSRIARMVDSCGGDVNALRETVDYYKSLYTVLSAQAMEQVTDSVRYDAEMIPWLLSLLRRENGGEQPDVSVSPVEGGYSQLCVDMPRLRLTDAECRALFTPLTCRLTFLLCRQIVREVGEVTNLRRCGIQAHKASSGGTVVEVILPAENWKL